MTDVQAALDSRAESFCQPCTAGGGAGGAGVDIRYDPQFEALQREIAKLEAPEGVPPDWKLVERETTQLTLAKSKDVLVLAWLAAAMHEREGLKGLATGVWILTTNIERYWDAMFPPVSRIKGRASAVTWLVNRSVTRIEAETGTPKHDDVDLLVASVRRAQSVLPDRFQDHAPGLRPLADAAERLRLSLPPRTEPAAPPPPAAPAPAAPPPAAPAAPAAPAPVAAAPAAAAPAAAAPAAVAAPAPASEGPSRVELLEARIAPFLAPVSAAQPAGDDLRYDPEHEWLRSEIAKLENPAGDPPDWKAIEKRASALVEKRSKDLLVASYLAWSFAVRDGVEGLATGLLLLAGAFWEPIHPVRAKARTAALSWLLGRVDLAFAEGSKPLAGHADREMVSRLELAARVFASMVRDKFVDDPPPTRPLLDNVERLKMSLPAPKPAAPPPPPPVTAAPAPTASTSAPAASSSAPTAAALPAAAAPTLAAGADATPFLQQSGAALTAAASTLRKANVGDPLAYRLLRIGLYLANQAPPPVTQAPKTGVKPPAPNFRQQLQTLANNAKWAPLLDEAESGLSQNRFWLDLHRYVSDALTQLGHGPAAKMVGIETVHVLRRMPELASLQFSDGSPFCTPETVEWLAGFGGGSGGGSAAPSDDPVEKAIAEAKALASGGKRDDALRALQSSVRTAADDHARFRLRLALARLCAQGNAPVARGLLEGLSREIDTLHLDTWDPSLAAEALRAYLDVLREGAKTNPRVAEESAEVYRRLCRIDVLLAVAAGG
jgi:type VI secretion system protein VasJ